MGAAGVYGDPLDRDLQKVAGDVKTGAVSAYNAEKVHGVIFDEVTGQVDAEATEKLRQRIREARLKTG